MKAIVGTTETITYEEAKKMEDDHLNELLVYLSSLADEATGDEDEKANIQVNLSSMLGKLLSCAVMRGVLSDEAAYLEETFGEFSDTVKIDCVSSV